MLMVRYSGAIAVWERETQLWASEDDGFEAALNATLPLERMSKVDAVFHTGGLEKMALDGAQVFFGKTLETVRFTPTPPPPEQEGEEA